MVVGDWRQGAAAADQWDDDEVHGPQAGTCAQTVQRRRQTEITEITSLPTDEAQLATGLDSLPTHHRHQLLADLANLVCSCDKEQQSRLMALNSG